MQAAEVEPPECHICRFTFCGKFLVCACRSVDQPVLRQRQAQNASRYASPICSRKCCSIESHQQEAITQTQTETKTKPPPLTGPLTVCCLQLVSFPK